MIADRHDGKRLNSPNDVVVKSEARSGSRPPYGIDSDYEGFKAESEIGACPSIASSPTAATAGSWPTTSCGRTGSPSPPTSAGCTSPTPAPATSTAGHGTSGRSTWATTARCPGVTSSPPASDGAFDGFRADTEGRIWTSAGSAVECYEPDGTLIGRVLVPETVSNVVFGGPKRHRLFICATTSLYWSCCRSTASADGGAVNGDPGLPASTVM